MFTSTWTSQDSRRGWRDKGFLNNLWTSQTKVFIPSTEGMLLSPVRVSLSVINHGSYIWFPSVILLCLCFKLVGVSDRDDTLYVQLWSEFTVHLHCSPRVVRTVSLVTKDRPQFSRIGSQCQNDFPIRHGTVVSVLQILQIRTVCHCRYCSKPKGSWKSD